MVTRIGDVLNPTTRTTKIVYGLIVGLVIGLLAILLLP